MVTLFHRRTPEVHDAHRPLPPVPTSFRRRPMNRLSHDAREIWDAGVDSVRAQPLIRREVRLDGEFLLMGDHHWNRADFDRILLVGAGKAATEMTSGFVSAASRWRPISGWINVPGGTERPIPGVTVHVARPAGSNEPTSTGVAGSRQIIELLKRAGQRDLCIALISGGGSALLPLPTRGITLDDKLAVTRCLSSGGATIGELNTVRKHLSDIKGGGMLTACASGELVTLVLSDVLGDPLDVIASGPTVLDSSTPADALDVLRRFDARRTLPESVYRTLELASPKTVSPTTQSTVIVIGNNAVAVDASGIRAESLGYNHVMQIARDGEGAAEDVGRHLAEMTLLMLKGGSNNCLITGGEPTVTLIEPKQRGRGGRNQQLVLAAYVHLLETAGESDPWNRFSILSGGTDGEDGPTDAAGAVLDASVHAAAQRLNLDPRDYLRRNDAYSFFEQAGGLIVTGPTGTNVCDVRVVTVLTS